MVEDVVHREGAEPPAVQQGEEEDFNEAVLGAQVEEDQEAGLEAGGAVVDSGVAEVVDLAVVGEVEAGVTERSLAGSENYFLYCNPFALYVFLY